MVPSPAFFAVQVGRTRGVFLSAEEANQQVVAFPHARMKKFNTVAQAQAFVDGEENPLLQPVQQVRLKQALSSDSALFTCVDIARPMVLTGPICLSNHWYDIRLYCTRKCS